MPKRKKPKKPNGYKVGYGRPPKKHQFKKGQSGNPKGRPKGLRNFATDVRSTLEAPVQMNEGGRKRKASTQKATLLRLREKALKGDPRSLDMFIGLAVQYNDQPDEQNDGRPLDEDDRNILDNFKARLLDSGDSLPNGPKRSRRRVRINEQT